MLQRKLLVFVADISVALYQLTYLSYKNCVLVWHLAFHSEF